MEHLAHARRKEGKRTPQEVLSWVRGKVLTPRQLQSAFRDKLWNRLTSRSGYVVIQNYYLYAERALVKQPVCLWLWEDTLHIEHQEEQLASYPCHYDAEEHHLRRIGEPVLHDNRFSRQQPQLFCVEANQWQRITQRETTRRARRRNSGTQAVLPGMSAQK